MRLGLEAAARAVYDWGVSGICSQLSFRFGAAEMIADPTGALWWPAESTLLVADLHLEKGSRLASLGVFLPPYDTATTLARLAAALERWRPSRVVALGDSFHDPAALDRMLPADRADLGRLMQGRDWIWIAGNHEEPAPRRIPRAQPAQALMPMQPVYELAGIRLLHEAFGAAGQEIGGHFHPSATVRVHGRRLRCRCFMTDGRTMILPAFGCYTGGLDVRDPALRQRFPSGFDAFLLGERQIHKMPSSAFA